MIEAKPMSTAGSRKRIIFICTHNSARSQMAEGLLRHMYNDRYEVYSAGIDPTEVQPNAVRVMKEVGIDISEEPSKSVSEFVDQEFDYIVTVCSKAQGTCPVFPGRGEVIHEGFEDPAAHDDSEAESLETYRRVRDEIKTWLRGTFGDPDSREG
jgi:arsenate reductase